MRSLRRLAILALPLLGSVLGQEPASPTKGTPKPTYGSPNEAFQELLNALPEESLHVALNSLAHFRDGIFESHRHGVERVHRENPPLATKLIVAAVQDLKKRQTPSNGTSTSQGPAAESSPPPASSSEAPPPQSSGEPPVVIPVSISTTDESGRATVISSEILSQPTASVVVPVTLTNNQGETVVTEETKPAVIHTTTDSAGNPSVITSAVDFAPTPGQVLTRTDARGSTFLTTYTPDGGRVSSVLLITTTGTDGRPSVITSYTFIDPAAATGTNGQPEATGTQTGKPGLQSGAANKNRAMEAVMVGAVGGAFAFFV